MTQFWWQSVHYRWNSVSFKTDPPRKAILIWRPCFDGCCMSGGSDIHPTQTSVSNKTALVLRKFDLVHLDSKTYSENLIFTVNLIWLFCQYEAQIYGKRAKRKTCKRKKRLSISQERFGRPRRLTASRTVEIIYYIFWTNSILPFRKLPFVQCLNKFLVLWRFIVAGYLLWWNSFPMCLFI